MTIFSCTWVAIHPNVPCPEKQNPVISFAGHRLPLFICALLVPEYVLAWAIRQFLRAREIANQDKGEFKTFSYFYHSKQFIVRATMVDDARVFYDHGRVPSL